GRVISGLFPFPREHEPTLRRPTRTYEADVQRERTNTITIPYHGVEIHCRTHDDESNQQPAHEVGGPVPLHVEGLQTRDHGDEDRHYGQYRDGTSRYGGVSGDQQHGHPVQRHGLDEVPRGETDTPPTVREYTRMEERRVPEFGRRPCEEQLHH